MTRPACILSLALVAALTCLPRAASAQFGPDMFELLYLAQTTPAQGEAEIDKALAEAQAQSPRDPRLLFDLVRLKAELVRDLDRPAEAAPLLGDLATFATRNPVLQEDPVALLDEASRLAEAAGDLRAARRYLQAKLSAQIDRNVTGEAIARTYREIARLSEALGDQAGADSARQAAEAALAPPQPGVKSARGDDEGFRPVDVYYATDRARSGSVEPSAFYGGGRGDGLELGVATVTIPNSHTPGMVEAPSIWRLEFAPNPAKHVVLQSITPLEKDGFYSRLQGEFADGDKTEAFVFIHGYNVTFDQAAKRAAQMAYDMDYPGVPILYSWPSRGMTIAYVADTAVVRLSGRRLAGFLEELAARSGAQTLHIVAHSMGNRALTDALEILALKNNVQPGDAPTFGQVLFAAPDVDAGLFARMIETIRPIAQRLTLYASDQDWALVSSRKLHGNAPRAGQGGENTLADMNVDSIDMSELGEDMLAHSYFADDSSALADMVTLFWRNTPPDRRCGLQEKRTDPAGPPIWEYQSGACATRNLIDAVAHLRAADATGMPELRNVLRRTAEDPALADRLEPVLQRMLSD